MTETGVVGARKPVVVNTSETYAISTCGGTIDNKSTIVHKSETYATPGAGVGKARTTNAVYISETIDIEYYH